MTYNSHFQDLYDDLARAWDLHQTQRRSNGSIRELAASSVRVHRARLAMTRWHRAHSEVTI